MFLFYSIIFLLGLAVGSFLNVVIFRLENGEKIINDRSKCMRCGHILAWHDLVPLLSFVWLRGKCRYCGESISIQYPLIELATGALFVLISNFQFPISNFSAYGGSAEGRQSISNFSAQGGPASGWQFLLSIPYLLFIASSLIVIFVYDLKHYIIPDKVVYPAIGIAFIYKLFEILEFGHWDLIGIWDLGFGILNPFLYLLFPAFAAGAFFYSIVVITRGQGMGGGDVKLAFLMGLVLGWPMIIVSVFLSFIIGSIFGILLILAGKKKMKSMIPFGPFLVLGTFVGLFWGEKIAGWYFRLMD